MLAEMFGDRAASISAAAAGASGSKKGQEDEMEIFYDILADNGMVFVGVSKKQVKLGQALKDKEAKAQVL